MVAGSNPVVVTWINIICDVSCREKISSNYMVVINFKNKNVHPSLFHFLLWNFMLCIYEIHQNIYFYRGVEGSWAGKDLRKNWMKMVDWPKRGGYFKDGLDNTLDKTIRFFFDELFFFSENISSILITSSECLELLSRSLSAQCWYIF